MTAILELLDPVQGLPLQSWQLEPGRVWQIGRSEQADIVIGNPLVSRAHAYLHERDGRWELVGLSDRGIVVDGEKRTSVPFEDGVEFRLASRGPLLRMRLGEELPPADSSACLATISYDEQTMPLLILDEQQRDREVEAISQDDYFRSVQQMAAKMRMRRQSRPDAP